MSGHVRAVGMLCPVGYSYAPACAAMRCGLNRKEELSYLDRCGEPVVGSAMHGWFETGTARTTRIATLAARSILDALRGRDPRELTQHPTILALASTLTPEQRTQIVSELCRQLGEALELRVDPRHIGVLGEDAVGGYRALAWASELFERGEAKACFVCAADSLIAARELLRLEQAGRLLNSINSDGFTPGEAGACVLVSADRGDALADILGIGFAREPATLTNDVPLRAQGLVEASHAALTQAGLALHEIDHLLSDSSGEGFFFKERALLLSRLLSTPKPTLPIWSCANTLGHTGAAAGLCNVVWALAARERGYAPGALALACAGSELELRAALVFSHQRRSA
ncbi:MAG: hypothetical protein R6X02_29635 [Enhygromyxa sp.]